MSRLHQEEFYVKCAKAFIKTGADLEQMNGGGAMPLGLALSGDIINATPSVLKQIVDTIHLLIEGGANCTAMNTEGKSPFMLAVKKGLDKLVVRMQRGKGDLQSKINTVSRLLEEKQVSLDALQASGTEYESMIEHIKLQIKEYNTLIRTMTHQQVPSLKDLTKKVIIDNKLERNDLPLPPSLKTYLHPTEPYSQLF